MLQLELHAGCINRAAPLQPLKYNVGQMGFQRDS